MLMFWFDVNFKRDEKLVPIIRRISTSIGPAGVEHVLKRVGGVPENGPLREQTYRNKFSATMILAQLFFSNIARYIYYERRKNCCILLKRVKCFTGILNLLVVILHYWLT